jgi:hypothetical protein
MVLLATEANTQNSSLYVYPSKGQSQAQQDRDKYECHSWAVSQSGFDASKAQMTSTNQQQPQGHVARGAARGAALGAVGGAIAGNAGTSAAAGASDGRTRGRLPPPRRKNATAAGERPGFQRSECIQSRISRVPAGAWLYGQLKLMTTSNLSQLSPKMRRCYRP